MDIVFSLVFSERRLDEAIEIVNRDPFSLHDGGSGLIVGLNI